MVQQVPTKLPIYEWARIMGINPVHFMGVNFPEMQQQCGGSWLQSAYYDSDRLGREEVAEAISSAEADLEALLGYRLLPTWEQDEWNETIRPFRRDAFTLNNRDIRGLGQMVPLRYGHLISGGIRQAVAIEAAAAIVYSNTKPPTTYDNLATVTVTAPWDISPCEIAVYYPGYGGDERYRISPVNVVKAGLTYTITFAREQALILDYIETYDLEAIRAVSGTDDANFLATVDVFRVYNDPQQQATMLWEPGPNMGSGGCSSCGGSGCAVCGYTTQTACLLTRGNPRLGMAVAHPAAWDETNLTFNSAPLAMGRSPDIIRYWYYAGLRDTSATCPTTQMDRDWARIVAHLAASKLDRSPCACVSTRWEYWSADLAFTHGATELASYTLSASDLGNPLGTRRGAVEAWRRLQRPGVVVAVGAYNGG